MTFWGRFLVQMKLGKKVWGKNSTILRKKRLFFFSNWENLPFLDFSANWECFRSTGNFFIQLGKNLVPETGPRFILRKVCKNTILPSL